MYQYFTCPPLAGNIDTKNIAKVMVEDPHGAIDLETTIGLAVAKIDAAKGKTKKAAEQAGMALFKGILKRNPTLRERALKTLMANRDNVLLQSDKDGLKNWQEMIEFISETEKKHQYKKYDTSSG